MNQFLLLGFAFLLGHSAFAGAPPALKAFDLKSQADLYRQRYSLHDPFAKLVNNTGDGYEALYGVRNFRAVLHGIYYRGGANNSFNKYGKRDNMNPLPTLGLKNLCAEGFSEAIYLYDKNYQTAPKQVACVNFSRENQSLSYQQISSLVSGNEKTLLKEIYQHIKGVKVGPMYAHCWNGWHASGYLAAISLQQFCSWTPTKAHDYWLTNTDGNTVGYTAIEQKIRAFRPFSDLNISASEKALICP